MARDSQAALVALHRFGFGARGGASGDLVNAASDPRGFVKSELGRPSGVLLEVPGLQSTPALASAVFAYQERVKLAREAAAKAGAPPSEAAPPQPAQPPADNRQRRNLSLNTVATDIAGKQPDAKSPDMKTPETGGANTGMAAGDSMQQGGAMAPNATMQPDAAKPPQPPLNVIQKTFRAEALARLQRAVLADCGFAERLVAFWSNHFCIAANKGELARIWAG